MNLLIGVRCDALPAYSVVIEDDGRVAYGYLLQSAHIVGDVWLYNLCEAPLKAEWTDRDKAPYANLATCSIHAEEAQRIIEAKDVSVEWEVAGTRCLHAKIKIRGQLAAILAPGSKPGWSALATNASPVAMPLTGFQHFPFRSDTNRLAEDNPEP